MLPPPIARHISFLTHHRPPRAPEARGRSFASSLYRAGGRGTTSATPVVMAHSFAAAGTDPYRRPCQLFISLCRRSFHQRLASAADIAYQWPGIRRQHMAENSAAPRHRSSPFPFIGLEVALERARVFHQKQRDHAAPIHVAASLWGLGAKSSTTLQSVAALKQFGLMRDDGGIGADRKVTLTPLALKIVRDTRDVSPDRVRALPGCRAHSQNSSGAMGKIRQRPA